MDSRFRGNDAPKIVPQSAAPSQSGQALHHMARGRLQGECSPAYDVRTRPLIRSRFAGLPSPPGEGCNGSSRLGDGAGEHEVRPYNRRSRAPWCHSRESGNPARPRRGMRFGGASNVDPRIREDDRFMDTDFSRRVIPAKAGIQHGDGERFSPRGRSDFPPLRTHGQLKWRIDRSYRPRGETPRASLALAK